MVRVSGSFVQNTNRDRENVEWDRDWGRVTRVENSSIYREANKPTESGQNGWVGHVFTVSNSSSHSNILYFFCNLALVFFSLAIRIQLFFCLFLWGSTNKPVSPRFHPIRATQPTPTVLQRQWLSTPQILHNSLHLYLNPFVHLSLVCASRLVFAASTARSMGLLTRVGICVHWCSLPPTKSPLYYTRFCEYNRLFAISLQRFQNAHPLVLPSWFFHSPPVRQPVQL